MYDYSPLWATMQRKSVSTYALINKHGVSKGTIHALKHNKSVTMETLHRLCMILECRIEEVVRVEV